MDQAPRTAIAASERAIIFQEEYGNEIDAGTTLADIVRAAGDYLGRIIGSPDADAGMARMVEGLAAASGYPAITKPSEWRDALTASRSYCYSEWALGTRLHDLAAYGIYGIAIIDGVGQEELTQKIEEMVVAAEDFLRATPLTEWGIDSESKGISDLSRLVSLARNRWELDNGRPIEPAALAQFGGVSEGRIRNMMSGTKRTFSTEGGRIPAQEALAWLKGREEFWTSIWREQRMPEYGISTRSPLTRAVFVPVARDGSAFHPGLQRGRHYTIGEKGGEVQMGDFDQALAELHLMPVPYWRRPNVNGNWGIVAGVRWERLDASDLEHLAANPDHKLLKTV